MKHDTRTIAVRLMLVCWSMVLVLGVWPVAGSDGMPSSNSDCGPVCGDEQCTYVIVDSNGITEESDPLPTWDGPPHPQEFTPTEDPVDSDSGYSDGAHLALNPATGYPTLTWSQMVGGDFEVRFAEGSGNTWLPAVYLTDDNEDDFDPRWWVQPNVATHVVWWHEDLSRKHSDVRLISRPQGGHFPDPEDVEVLAQNGRRPSIVSSGSILFIAFERPVNDGGQEVWVIKYLAGAWSEERIGWTSREEPLNLRLRKIDGVISMVWDHAEGLSGYTEYRNGKWRANPSMFLPSEYQQHRPIEMRPGLLK